MARPKARRGVKVEVGVALVTMIDDAVVARGDSVVILGAEVAASIAQAQVERFAPRLAAAVGVALLDGPSVSSLIVETVERRQRVPDEATCARAARVGGIQWRLARPIVA